MTDYRLVRTDRPAAEAPVLDPAQRAVVEHGPGPLLVLAGPGTGKTTTLVEAVVARAAAGVPVDSMLMLTFSRRAAGELRDRVAARLRRTVREPVARTLHSYAFGVLRMANAARGLPAPRLLSAAEQDIVFRELLAERDPARWPASLRPALRTAGFADELRDLLMRAVERGLDGPALTELGRARSRPDWVAAGEFLAEYHSVYAMRDPGAYDPAELVRTALNALRDDPVLLAAERSRRRRIFVDEYQDTDPGQAELLQVLAAGADELILVGDPDQSIYAFRGADESAMSSVDERFGAGARVPVVALTRCRRSGPVLLAATRRLAARLPGRAEQRALAAADGLPPGQVEAVVFRTVSEEAAHVAAVLRQAHLDGLAWDRMAVLVRSTASTLGVFRRAFATVGVPAAVRGDDLPVAEQPAVELMLRLLECVVAPAVLDEQLADQLVSGPLGGGDALYLRRLRRELRRAHPDEGGRLTPVLHDDLGDRTLPDRLRRPVERIVQVLVAGRAAVASGASTEGVLWALWDASGLARRWERASAAGGSAGVAADRDLDAVLELFAAAADFTDRLPGSAPLQFLDHVRARQIPGDTFVGASAAAPDGVAILTAHASKGLEWDLVCISGVQEGVWPDLRRRGSLLGVQALMDAVRGVDDGPLASLAPQLAEERRLFYVAASRARCRLVATAVAGDEDQPSRLLDELDPIEGVRPVCEPILGVHLPGLIAELRAVVCAPPGNGPGQVPVVDRFAAAAELARLAAAGVPGADPDEWWGLAELSSAAPVADPARPVRVSPSRVESFLTCELRSLMQDLGVQDAEAPAAALGTLVHELAAAAPDDQALAVFEAQLAQRWPELDFGAPWFAENQRARATAMLERLVTWLHSSRSTLTRVGVEVPFQVAIGDAVLAGRVDRLEHDGHGRLVVADLKTGGTKPAEKEMSRHLQLGVYQLAVEEGAFDTDTDVNTDTNTDPDIDAGSAASVATGARAGGAVLVQLGTKGGVEQWQPARTAATPEPDAESDIDWARAAVQHVAERMRGAQFTAIVNDRCEKCDVRTCCPLQPRGQQVVS